MDGVHAGAEVPCPCGQRSYRDNQRLFSSHTDSCSSVGGRGNPNTHPQHMGRPQHVGLGTGGTRSGDAGGDGHSAAADLR